MDRITRMKRPETWARAVGIKACKDILNHCSSDFFPALSFKAFEIIENKRWQLDKILIETL